MGCILSRDIGLFVQPFQGSCIVEWAPFPFYRFMSGSVLVCQEMCEDVVWLEGLGHSVGIDVMSVLVWQLF